MQQEKNFGDFEELKEQENPEDSEAEQEQQIVRARNPRNGELIGIIVQKLGGNRMDVLTTDGKTRNCRVPGRYRRRLWLRPRDIILIVPWEFDDSKGDIVYKYPPSAVNQLKKKGVLDSLKQEF